MRLREMIICCVSLLIAAFLFVAAGMQLGVINAERGRLGLTIERPQDVPPSIAFATVATGAFRGLVVDALWLRAERLKQEGQFFDAKQLAEWITILQPRFATVWEFQAWNMAYNISVTIPATDPQERWRWVKNGFELLRDKAIPLNPGAISLYRNLATIFQHKIGGVTDDAHNFYKLQLALEMEPLLGPADNQYFRALAKAPVEWRQIAEDANMTGMISRLRSADKAFATNNPAEFVGSYLSLRQMPARFSPQAFVVIDEFRGTKQLEKLDVFARAYQLRNTWKLQPEIMEQINQLYGPYSWDDPNKHLPLDWRHPDTHAMYWAYVGLKVAGKDKFSPDQANTDRMIYQSLQELFRQGKIYIYSAAVPPEGADANSQSDAQVKAIYLRPDLRMFKPYNESVMNILEKYKIMNQGSYSAMQIGHRNMLKNAVLNFYQAGHRQQAMEIYALMRKLYPLDDFKVSIDVFVKQRFREEIVDMGLNSVRGVLQMILQEAYFYYAMRDDNEAAVNENIAKEAYDMYQERFGSSSQGRLGLPEFGRLKYFALLDFINDYQYPAILKENLYKRIEVEKPELYQELNRWRLQMIEEKNKAQSPK
jgi:hypothetical protein